MSEVSCPIDGQQVLGVRLEANEIQGRSVAGQPALYLPLSLQLLPGGQQRDVEYTMVRFGGNVRSPDLGELADFETLPIAEVSHPNPHYRRQEVAILLDRVRAKRLEDSRAGKDANLQLTLRCLIWYHTKSRFDVIHSAGVLNVLIPKSHWVERVLSPWNLSSVKVVEIEFPNNKTGENFRTSYARVEEAEKQFASGNYKETLTTLRRSFEALAGSFGFERNVKDCFTSILAAWHPDKKEKASDAILGFYRLLHLGPHEQSSLGVPTDEAIITRQDARFALTMAYAIFEYVTPKG